MCTLAGGRDSRARVSRRDVQSHLEWTRNLGGVGRGLIMPALSIPQLFICLLLLIWYTKRHFSLGENVQSESGILKSLRVST